MIEHIVMNVDVPVDICMASDDGRYWWADCPDAPGVRCGGADQLEVLSRMVDAVRRYFLYG